MSQAKVISAIFDGAEALLECDDLSDSFIFSDDAIERYRKSERLALRASDVIRDAETAFSELIAAMNEEKDGSMFLCKEAAPVFKRAAAAMAAMAALAEDLQ